MNNKDKTLIEKLNRNLDNHRRSIKIDVFTEPKPVARKNDYIAPEISAVGIDKVRTILEKEKDNGIVEALKKVEKIKESSEISNTADEAMDECKKMPCVGFKTYYTDGVKNMRFTLEIEGDDYPMPDEIVDFGQNDNSIFFTVRPKTENLYLDKFQVGKFIGPVFLNIDCPSGPLRAASIILAHTAQVESFNWFIPAISSEKDGEYENDYFQYHVEITIKD